MDEQLPQVLESERAILAAIILDSKCLDETVEMLKPEDFTVPSHRTVYKAYLGMAETKIPIEPVTLIEYLQQSGELALIGGVTFLGSLLDGAVRMDSLSWYCRRVRMVADYRKTLRTVSSVLTDLIGSEVSEESLTDAQSRLMDVFQRTSPNGARSMFELCSEYLHGLESRSPHSLPGMATGFRDFDSKTLGLQRKELTIIAARPSQGKTTWATNIARNLAQAGHRVLIFSLEMSGLALGEKVLSADTYLDSYQLRSGALAREHWRTLADTLHKLDIPLYVCDESSLTTSQARARMNRFQREHGLDCVIFDYLQLLAAPERRIDEYAAVTRNVRDLKRFAKDLDCSVIALSQLSRAPEQRANPEPELSDLRQSGQIEQDADIVAFLYRLKSDDQHVTRVKLAKNRSGATGIFGLRYEKKFNRFDDLAGGLPT